MKKTQRTFAEYMVYFCKVSAILIFAFTSDRAYSQCSLTCSNVNLSLDTIKGGKTTLTPESILTTKTSCEEGEFILEMYDPAGNKIGNMIDCQWVGYTLIAKVTDNNSKNSCWSKVKIEDKKGPNLECVKDTISCLVLNSYTAGLDKFPNGLASDNCGISSKVNISIVCKEFPCSNTEFVAICERTVIATDQWGLTSSCKDSLWIARDTLSFVIKPNDTTIQCSIADTIRKDQYGNPIPERVGVPTIKGNPVWPNNNVCKIISRYNDANFPLCGKSRKIRRQWTVTDWCTKKDTMLIQWILITDTVKPIVLIPPPAQVVSASAHACNVPFDLGRPNATDCNGLKPITYSATIYNDGATGVFPTVISGTFNGTKARIYLPSGTHEIIITVSDSCGNYTEVIQEVTVLDLIPPTPVCDERTATTLDPNECSSRVYAADLDNGSTDNCCQTLYFAAVHMDTLTKYQNLLTNAFKSKYGLSAYNSNQSKINLIIDKYINCKYFDEYIDMTKCGNQQVVLRVYEACGLPLYDPHVNGDRKHLWYCNAAYKPENVNIESLIAKVLGNASSTIQDVTTLSVASKNYNDCMVWINVADKQAPVCTVAPTKTVYCDGVKGKLTPGQDANQQCNGANGIYDGDSVLVKADKYDTGSKIDPYKLFDSAIFKDNCGTVSVTMNTTGGLNNCTAGTMTRTWTGTDECGVLKTICSQQLIVKHRSDFEVVFPKDETVSCISDLKRFDNPSGDLYPKIFDDDCEQIGVSYEDVKYEIATGACYKIIRTWKLIDWCAYNPDLHQRNRDYIVDSSALYHASQEQADNRYCTYRWLKDNGDGYITYTQIIKVVNNIAPTITKRDSLVVCADNDVTCQGRVRLRFGAKDDCTDSTELKWNILVDLGNNGSVDNIISATGPTALIDGSYAVGIHKFTFVVRDLCGNETSRPVVVDVRLCKKPTPYLLNGLAANLMPIDTNRDGRPDRGMLTIWAKDFDAGSFASCGQSLVAFSFSSDTTKKSITYTCDSVGTRNVRVWVTDSYGNQDFATTYILIQDNNKACTGGTQALTASINGAIRTEDRADVEKVNVNLDGSQLATTTKSDGGYAFTNMQVGGNYKIMPKKNINATNGVSTLDLLLIQKHILGIQPLSSPYKIIAADINKSKDISSVDLLELRKLILGIYENFDGNESWRFVPSDHTFKNASNPFEFNFPEYKEVPQFTKNVSADFVGIKVGDVNGSVTANQLMGSEVRNLDETITLQTKEQNYRANEVIRVPVSAESIKGIQGYQFTLAFNTNQLEFVDIETTYPGMSKQNFGLQQVAKGMISTSYVNTNSSAPHTDALFSVVLKAKKVGKLSESLFINSKITTAEAYTDKHEVIGVKWAIGTDASVQEITLLQNRPNPFVHQSRIAFTLPAASDITLTIFDMNGKTIKAISGNYQKGYNEVTINKSDVRNTGVYYYQLQTNGFKATRKMIVIE